VSRLIRTLAEYDRLVKADRGHGFAARLIECECGRTFAPEKFEDHLREMTRKDFAKNLRRALRVPDDPS
jgi:hypothetical protein